MCDAFEKGGDFAHDLLLFIWNFKMCIRDRLSLFKGENNGVLLTNDHYLIPRTEKANESQLAKNIHSVSVFADAVDAPVYVVPLPRPVDVFSDKLPVFYPKQLSQTLFEQFEKLSEQAGLSIIDLYDPLCDSNYYYLSLIHISQCPLDKWPPRFWPP